MFLTAVLVIAWREVTTAEPRGRGSVGRAYLVVIEGASRHFRVGERIPIEGAASIGRDSDNQIVVNENTVSGRHAAFVFREGRWWVEDVGSTNGTWVNQRQVHEPHAVDEGDLIQVGRFTFRLAGRA